MSFEKEFDKNALNNLDMSSKSSVKTLTTNHAFHGIIGRCFEPHLNIYIQSLDRYFNYNSF